jgi:biotin carboxyl carrier protein
MGDFRRLVIDDTPYVTRTTRKFEERKPYQPTDPRRIHALIPGVIQQVNVKPGQKVRGGDSLLVLEAMKMKNDIRVAGDGVVKAVRVSLGQMVTKGQLLVELE